MSGYKHATVTISEADYRHLHESDMQDRFSRPAKKEAVETKKEVEALRKALKAYEGRQQGFQEYIAGLENEIGQLEIDTAQALLDQQDDLQESLSGQIASYEQESNFVLNSIVQSLAEQMEGNQRRHMRQLTMMKRHLDSLSQGIGRKVELAQNWLNGASALRNFIEDNYDHNRFMPGTMEHLDMQYQQAAENLDNNLPEAALLGAQMVYLECSQKRFELEKLTSQWQIFHESALERVEKLFETLRSNRVIPALDAHGHELPNEIDLDQWSDHRYSILARQLKNLRSRLGTEPESLSVEELKELITLVVPHLKEEFDNLVYQARLAVIYSQIRINIADIAIQALERQGFRVEEHGFADNNQKQPYFISMQNIEGSQVLIRVNPILHAGAANDLVIESQDNTVRTETELRSRSQEILRSLTQYGLRVGSLSTNQETPLNGLIPAVERINGSSRPELSRV